jgi:CRP/FNR family cyclic AMP-dependent transcriptional regulator
LTLAARAIEAEQEGHMELISRMMDGSYDGEHRLEPVLSRAAVREDESLFKAVPIFEGCTKKQLRHVANIARIFDAPAGSVLTRAGEPGDVFFLILDGTVRVEVASGRYVSLHPGAFFGEMSLLDGGPRSATAVSDTSVRLLVIDRGNFSRLQREVPELTQTLLVTLSQRVRQVEAREEQSARGSRPSEEH